MAISTSIDGNASGGMGQLFDLLAVVSDPKAYNDKLQALQEAADRNQKYVELVAPAADILTLRDAIRAEKAEADEALAAAKAEATRIIAEADKIAGGIFDDAMQKATMFKNDADRLQAAAKEANALAAANLSAAADKMAQADKALANASSAMASVKLAEENAAKAMADAQALKEAIIAKHKAFIESLG